MYKEDAKVNRKCVRGTSQNENVNRRYNDLHCGPNKSTGLAQAQEEEFFGRLNIDALARCGLIQHPKSYQLPDLLRLDEAAKRMGLPAPRPSLPAIKQAYQDVKFGHDWQRATIPRKEKRPEAGVDELLAFDPQGVELAPLSCIRSVF
jgi:hypothetical protein